MRFKRIGFLIIYIICFGAQAALCQDAPRALNSTKAPLRLSLDQVIDRVEARYGAADFTASFFQATTINSMDITDSASGQIFVKRPGMMRWEYQQPELQTIITDGSTLWIYRPEDHQVMIGKAPAFFKDGKGAGFLSDIRLLRSKFHITIDNEAQNDSYTLKLFPIEKTFDVSIIYLSISAKTFYVDRITTHNSYGDKTRFDLSNIRFNQKLDDTMFRFQVPEGAEVLSLDE